MNEPKGEVPGIGMTQLPFYNRGVHNMGEYKDLKTGTTVEIVDEKNFVFPTTGAKMLLKVRPPISKEAKTD